MEVLLPIQVGAWFKAWVCSLAGIVGLKPAGGMDVYPLRVLRVVKERSLHWEDGSSLGFLPCTGVSDCDHDASRTPRCTGKY